MNQQNEERERMARTHNHPRSQDKIPQQQQQQQQQQDEGLLCACNGLECDGVCRETHLYKPRYANPKPAKKDAGVRKQWAEKCPQAYNKDQKPEHYRA